MHVPTDPAQPSLNLAQAVLLLAYELRLAVNAKEGTPNGEARASAGALEDALQELRGALLDIGYLDPLNPDHILPELRRLAARAGLTPREVTVLRGLARQMSWAAALRGAGQRPHNFPAASTESHAGRRHAQECLNDPADFYP